MPFNLLPEGLYHGTIRKQDFYNTKEDGSGTLYFAVDVLLTHKNNDVGKKVELEQPVRRQAKFWLNSPDNVKRASGQFRFLGFKGTIIERLNPWWEPHVPTEDEDKEVGEEAFSFIDKEVSLDITHQENKQNGEAQESIWLNMAAKPLDKSGASAQLSRISEAFAILQRDAAEKRKAYQKDKEDHSNEVKKEEDVPASIQDQLNQADGDSTPPF